jgi:uncharacterized protein YhdP
MGQREIPRTEWQSFCEQFSKQHQGWLVTLTDVHGSTNGKSKGKRRASKKQTPVSRTPQAPPPEARVVASDLALRQIIAEREGRNVGLKIVAGDGPRRVTHLVLDPSQIRVEKTRHGADRGLRICDAENQATLVRFNVPRLS